MKSPRTAIHLVIGLEGILLVLVIVFSVLNPVKKIVVKENTETNVIADNPDTQEPDTQVQNTENSIDTELETNGFSDAVKEKLATMSLEQKVAQMFITTPEQLTNMRQVTATGNTTKTAISTIPVGGLIYSALNFEGQVQTASMTLALQDYYKEQFGMPLFMLVEEAGGADASPLATANGFTVELSQEEIAATDNADIATAKAANIAAYMEFQNLNANMGIYGDVLTATTADATIRAYHEVNIASVIVMGDAYREHEDVYRAAVMADVDMMKINTAFTGELSQYVRRDLAYQGILMTEVQSAEDAIAAIQNGASMVYSPNEFKTVYQSVLDAVANGSISEEAINDAVMRILTYKDYE